VTTHPPDRALRRTVALVAALNLAYFGVEFVAASAIGSASLFADSVDFLEDTSVNVLILVGLGWSARGRARLGVVLAAILLVPSLATAWTVVRKLGAPVAPEPFTLSAAALGALLVNMACAFMFARFRAHTGSLTRAAFLSARNDMVANLAMIAAGVVTATIWRSAWPDLIVGIAIGLLNLGAAKEVWEAARLEHQEEP
jgi:Co/Zn/Cd efflux system component